MNSYLNVGTAIFNSLKDIGFKVYPLVADNDAKLPFAVYKRNSLQLESSKDGIYQNTVTMEINVVAEKYSQSIEKAELIISKLKGIELEGYCLEAKFIDANESYEGNNFIQTLFFNIIINKN